MLYPTELRVHPRKESLTLGSFAAFRNQNLASHLIRLCAVRSARVLQLPRTITDFGIQMLLKESQPMLRYLFVTSSLALLSMAPSCSAPQDSTESVLESISDVESMVRLPDGTFRVNCRNGTTETRTESEILANRVCTTGQGGIGASVYGRSDRCDADSIIGIVKESTDCNTFSTSQTSWSVKVSGQCIDISDTNARNACIFAQGSLPNVGTVFARSDSCGADAALGTVTRYTDCSAFATSGSAWSISFAGRCQDISDTTPFRACMEVKGQMFGAGVIYGRSDSCDSDRALMAVDEQTDCNSLSASEAAWSVKVAGQCQDISDTSVRNACFVIQGG